MSDALSFISFANKAEKQKAFSENIAYGPANKSALGMIDKKKLAELPNASQNNAQFWMDYGETFEQRFNAWAAR